MTIIPFSKERKDEIIGIINNNEHLSIRELGELIGIHHSTVCRLRKFIRNQSRPDDDLIVESSLKKSLEIQRLRDTQRIERKEFRGEARVLNSSNDLFSDLIELIKQSPTPVIKPVEITQGGTLIIQLSDLHFGETVSLANNEFNTEIQSKRLYAYTKRAVEIGLSSSCRRVVFVLTGDLINSSRREGEALSNEYNSAHAVLNAFEMISHMIQIVNQSIRVTNVISVCGNESRINQELSLEHKVFLNNYDYIIHSMLKAKHSEQMLFSDFGNPVERLLEIDGMHIGIAHGLTRNKMTPAKQLEYFKQKYGQVDYLLVGHMHEPLCAPGYSRSGSTVGSNAYSEFLLGIPKGVPSQSCHVVSDQSVTSFPVDLSRHGNEGLSYSTPPKSRNVMKSIERV
jgi:predicted phosphodiesterase